MTGRALSIGDGSPAIPPARALRNFERDLDLAEGHGGDRGASGTVFCFHPHAPGTLAALPQMIDYAQAKGYRVVGLSELAGIDDRQVTPASRHMPLP